MYYWLLDGGSFEKFKFNTNEWSVDPNRSLVYITSQGHNDRPTVLFDGYSLVKSLHIADNYGMIMKSVTICNCPLLEKIEIGKRVYSGEDTDDSSILTIRDCPSLESILINDYSFMDTKHLILESNSCFSF